MWKETLKRDLTGHFKEIPHFSLHTCKSLLTLSFCIMFVHIWVYIYIHYMYIHIYVFVHICMHAHTYIYVYTHILHTIYNRASHQISFTFMYKHTSLRWCLFLHLYINLDFYILTYIFIYTHLFYAQVGQQVSFTGFLYVAHFTGLFWHTQGLLLQTSVSCIGLFYAKEIHFLVISIGFFFISLLCHM